MTLFDEKIPKNTAPADDTDITTLILYLSTDELKAFRLGVKEGMKAMWPEDYRERTFTDYLLTLVKKDNDANVKA